MSVADPEEAAARGCRALGVDFPLVQAGMGGIAGPALAAAVSDAGALGTVALYRSDHGQAGALVAETARRTPRTFGVNVIPEVAGRLLPEQIRALLDTADRPLLLNSYGLPPQPQAAAVLGAGHRLLVQVGSVAEAATAAALGAHAVVLQGVEAGGHHLGDRPVGELLGELPGELPGELSGELSACGLEVPVLVAGAVATGGDLHSALCAGASGALCGTAFVATRESAAHAEYKRALIRAEGSDTVVSDRFSIGWPGRPHRVLRSPVTDAAEPLPAVFVAWTTVMGDRRPVPRGSAAAPTVEAEGAVAEMARYAGLGCGRVTAMEPAGQVVARFRAEFRAALADSPTAPAHG